VTRVPPGWAEVPLEDLAAPMPRSITDGPFGSNLKTEHYTADGPRVVRLQNIGDGRFCDDESHISEDRYQRLRAHDVQPGDVLVAALGEVLPRACLAPSWLGPAIVKADCFRFRLRDGVNPHFVVAMLNSPPIRSMASSQITGVGRPRLNLGKVRKLSIPLPPTAMQNRIVTVIEEHFSRLDTADLSLAKCLTYAERLRRSILSDAFCTEWPSLAIGEFASVGSGATPKRGESEFYEGGTIPWVTSAKLLGQFVAEPTGYITERALKETSVRLWPPHTLLVAMYGEGRTRGHCSELLFESTTNQACAAILIRDDQVVSRSFLKLFFVSSYETNRRLSSGGVQPNLSLGIIRSLRVPLPPRPVQDQVVERVERELSIIESLETATKSALVRSKGLRSSILSCAFAGQLLPTRHELSTEVA
jgi:type I restriction enzyme S subunit